MKGGSLGLDHRVVMAGRFEVGRPTHPHNLVPATLLWAKDVAGQDCKHTLGSKVQQLRCHAMPRHAKVQTWNACIVSPITCLGRPTTGLLVVVGTRRLLPLCQAHV